MSIDPQQLWSERFREIGSLIEAHAEVLVERWSARALIEQPTADEVMRHDLRNGLPDWLRALGRGLAASSEQASDGHRWIALEHGEQRWNVGWKLSEVVRDYQILRLVILEFLEATLPQPLQTRECMAVGLGIDEAIGVSIAAYVRNEEESLRATHRRMNEFLSVLSHELRNFLAPLTSALDVQELEQPEAGASQLHGIMRRSTEHLTRLVGDLLDVSRASSGKLTIAPQSVRVQEIVGRALEMTQTAMTERSQAVHVDLPRQDIWVQGDPFRLTQVFVNLLHNASKYSPHGKSIYVDLHGEGLDAVLRVRDEGIGIAPDMLPEVFKLFVQAEAGPSRNSGGLGIGLALVSKLIELHGGSVSASSPGVGQGSEFVARLPIAGAAEAVAGTPESARPAVPKSAGKRVLIIDDHHDGALALAVYLRTRGHVVEIGHSAEDALVLVDQFVPEIIILDIGLPRVDGYQVARQLRNTAVGAAALLLAVTGFGQDDDREKAQQAGFNHFLVKPVNLDRLSHLVEGTAANR